MIMCVTESCSYILYPRVCEVAHFPEAEVDVVCDKWFIAALLVWEKV